MATDPDAQRFPSAALPERAVLLLRRAFRDPREESVSRLDVARAIASDAGSRASGTPGSVQFLGSPSPDPRVLRLASEAWQVLESARLVWPDLNHPEGDWWVLTAAGRQARDSSDPEGEIRLRVTGL